MEAIAQNRATTIEDLPIDALRQIVIRVAGPPNGEVDVARTFAVSKTFRKFSEDEDVLKALDFKSLLDLKISKFAVSLFEIRRYIDVESKYERFHHLGGLVVRSAEAGNPDAQFILAKLIMLSTSVLVNVMEVNKFEASLRRQSVIPHRRTVRYNSDRIAQAITLIDHFSSAAGEKLQHHDVVRMFMSRANLADIKSMMPHLQDYTRHFVKPEKEMQLRNFLSSLQNLFDEKLLELLPPPDPNGISPLHLHHMCYKGLNLLRDLEILGEEKLRFLQQSLVQINYQVNIEDLFHFFDTDEQKTIRVQEEMISVRSYFEFLRLNKMLRSRHINQAYLVLFVICEAFAESSMVKLLSRFNALF